jgi:hypothetical protein
LAALVTFGSIAIGSVGSLGAGWEADRIGRPTVTSLSMLISGSCALIIGRFFGGSPILITAIALIWGLFVVADSAQFSASVSELADSHYIGTALSSQTSLGFLPTLFSIRMIPFLVAHSIPHGLRARLIHDLSTRWFKSQEPLSRSG